MCFIAFKWFEGINIGYFVKKSFFQMEILQNIFYKWFE